MPDEQAELAALERYCSARQARLTACVETDLFLQSPRPERIQ